jgi:hypothetical protein
MDVGVVTVRKRWNNAPTSLSEGIKKGITSLKEKNESMNGVNFIFTPFTIHDPYKLYIDPSTVSDFQTIIIPFWIGERIFKCNLSELKEKLNIKICLYTGLSTYQFPHFNCDFNKKTIEKNNITDQQWKNFESVDKFFVVKKLFSYNKEIEVGCGQFDEFIHINKPATNMIILDFCKKAWDEFIWEDFKKAWPEIRRKSNVQLIQLGEYPFKIEGAGIFNRKFVHFKRMMSLYSRSKIFISMNESFGYPLLENKFAGNIILVHDQAEIPNFHLRSDYVIPWNSKNISSVISNYLENISNNKFSLIREDFVKSFEELCSWEKTVRKIINELQQI